MKTIGREPADSPRTGSLRRWGKMPPVGRVALDANVLDQDGSARDAQVDGLLHLIETGALSVVVPESVGRELDHPRTPRAIRALGLSHAIRRVKALSAAQHIGRIRVRAVLRGNTDSAKHDADARHLSEADEAGCACFVTRDRRILRKRADLEASFASGMRVMGLAELLALYDGTNEVDP